MNLQTRGESIGALQAVTVRSSLWTSYHKHTLNLKDEGGSLRLSLVCGATAYINTSV